MNQLAQVIYNMEQGVVNSDLIAKLSAEEKQMLVELSSLLGQTGESIATRMQEGPVRTDWAFVPPLAPEQ